MYARETNIRPLEWQINRNKGWTYAFDYILANAIFILQTAGLNTYIIAIDT